MSRENFIIVNIATIFFSLKLFVEFPMPGILLTTAAFVVSLFLSIAGVILFPRREPYLALQDMVSGIARMIFWSGCVVLIVYFAFLALISHNHH